VLGVLLAVALIWAFTRFVRGSDGLPLFVITLPPALALRWPWAPRCAACWPRWRRRAAPPALDPAQAIRL
jgi:lipoprotein-releasing system permease protein